MSDEGVWSVLWNACVRVRSRGVESGCHEVGEIGVINVSVRGELGVMEQRRNHFPLFHYLYVSL